MAKKPLLVLSTLAPERESITVNDKDYFLRVEDDFGLEEMSILENLRTKLFPLVDRFYNGEITEDSVMGGALSAEELHEMGQGLNDFCRMIIIDCPESLLNGKDKERLNDHQKVQVIEVFMQAATEKMKEKVAVNQPVQKNRKARRTGE